MITISLCMIVKNEEQTLPRCLDSVRHLVDELVIVDTGSTDRTVEIARSYTDRIFPFSWQDDFAAARNFSFEQATMDYCMWLDADDVLEAEDQARFVRLKETLPPDTDMVMLPYHTAFDEAGRPTFTCNRERLVRRAAGFRWAGAVHEAIAPSGVVRRGDAAVSHRKIGSSDPDRNLRIFQSLLQKGPLSPRNQFYYARELTCHGRDQEAIQIFRAFLDQGQGWVVDNIQACRDLAACWNRLNRPDLAFAALTEALRYGPPQAELCCDLGQYFFDRADWRTAVFWYELAAAQPADSAGEGFSSPDCHDYIPFLQLCVCWFRLGEPDKAESYNDAAAGCKPDSPVCRRNREFFLHRR